MSTAVDKHIIVFTKYPIAGFAKTRLIPRLGAAGAADVSRKLSERCVLTARQFARKGLNGSVTIRVFYAGGTRNEMEVWLGDGIK